MGYLIGGLIAFGALLAMLWLGAPLIVAGFCNVTDYACTRSQKIFENMTTGKAFGGFGSPTSVTPVTPPPPGYRWSTQTTGCTSLGKRSVIREADGRHQCV